MTSTPIHPDGWARPQGYAHGVIARGTVLFVAGQVGSDPRAPVPSFSPSFAEQFDRALANVLEVLSSAGGRPDALCRLTLYVTDRCAYREAREAVGESWRRRVGSIYPAMTLIEVAGLLDDGAKLELEATAVLAP